MTLARATRIKDVKVRRADQRLMDLQRSRRQLNEAKAALRAAEKRVEEFKRERTDAMHDAYAAIIGEEVGERDLRNLNQRLDKLIEHEKGLVNGLDTYHKAIQEAEEELRLATLRFQAAYRNQQKWGLMVEPMAKAASREAERKVEIEREDNPRRNWLAGG